MNIALVLAGGTGSRLGADIPKQYIEVGDRMIIDYCLETLDVSEYIDKVWIVADSMWQEYIRKPRKFTGFALPGKNRQLSIYNGLKAIEKSMQDIEDINVLIHDAARPLLSRELIAGCVRAVSEHDGVLPVLPMKDTVYFSEDGKIISGLLDRGKIFAGQAPECFNFKKYLAANEALLPDAIMAINGSTEPAVMAGMDVVMIPGDEKNFKITTKEDLERFKEIVFN